MERSYRVFEILEKYKEHGQFTFKPTDRLSQVCNAPREGSGIYLIYADVVNSKRLIYIGISGREGANGEIIHRKDGLGGRIVKGKQFGDRRQVTWPHKMQEDGISTLIIKWYITYGEFNKDIPRKLENGFLDELLKRNESLPIWNNET